MSQESNIEKLVGVATLPPFIPALWNIGILLLKQAKQRTIMNTTVSKEKKMKILNLTIYAFQDQAS